MTRALPSVLNTDLSSSSAPGQTDTLSTAQGPTKFVMLQPACVMHCKLQAVCDLGESQLHVWAMRKPYGITGPKLQAIIRFHCTPTLDMCAIRDVAVHALSESTSPDPCQRVRP